MKSKPIQRRLNLLAGFGVFLLLLGGSFKVWDHYDYPLPGFIRQSPVMLPGNRSSKERASDTLLSWRYKYLIHPKYERNILSDFEFTDLQCEYREHYLDSDNKNRKDPPFFSESGALTFHQDGRLTVVAGPLSFEATNTDLRFERVRRNKIRIFGDGIECDLTIEIPEVDYLHLIDESQNLRLLLFAPNAVPEKN